MRRWALLSICVAAGCATGQVEVNKVAPYQVKEAIHCQLAQALADAISSNDNLKAYAASYVITLKVERQYGAGLTTLDWVIPYNADVLKLGAGLSLQDRKMESTVLKGKVTKKDGTTATWCADKSGLKPFRGDLGVADWLRSAVGSHLKPGDFGHTIEFGVVYDGNLRPGFVVTNLTGSAGLSSNQKLTNTLDIAFFDATPAPPQKVIIVDAEGKKQVVTTPAPVAPPSGDRILDYLLLNRTNIEER